MLLFLQAVSLHRFFCVSMLFTTNCCCYYVFLLFLLLLFDNDIVVVVNILNDLLFYRSRMYFFLLIFLASKGLFKCQLALHPPIINSTNTFWISCSVKVLVDLCILSKILSEQQEMFLVCSYEIISNTVRVLILQHKACLIT